MLRSWKSLKMETNDNRVHYIYHGGELFIPVKRVGTDIVVNHPTLEAAKMRASRSTLLLWDGMQRLYYYNNELDKVRLYSFLYGEVKR